MNNDDLHLLQDQEGSSRIAIESLEAILGVDDPKIALGLYRINLGLIKETMAPSIRLLDRETLESFSDLGVVTTEGIYDNIKNVIKDLVSKFISFIKTAFKALMKFLGFGEKEKGELKKEIKKAKDGIKKETETKSKTETKSIKVKGGKKSLVEKINGLADTNPDKLTKIIKRANDLSYITRYHVCYYGDSERLFNSNKTVSTLISSIDNLAHVNMEILDHVKEASEVLGTATGKNSEDHAAYIATQTLDQLGIIDTLSKNSFGKGDTHRLFNNPEYDLNAKTMELDFNKENTINWRYDKDTDKLRFYRAAVIKNKKGGSIFLTTSSKLLNKMSVTNDPFVLMSGLEDQIFAIEDIEKMIDKGSLRKIDDDLIGLIKDIKNRITLYNELLNDLNGVKKENLTAFQRNIGHMLSLDNGLLGLVRMFLKHHRKYVKLLTTSVKEINAFVAELNKL